jgi:hypothetical protein
VNELEGDVFELATLYRNGLILELIFKWFRIITDGVDPLVN